MIENPETYWKEKPGTGIGNQYKFLSEHPIDSRYVVENLDERDSFSDKRLNAVYPGLTVWVQGDGKYEWVDYGEKNKKWIKINRNTITLNGQQTTSPNFYAPVDEGEVKTRFNIGLKTFPQQAGYYPLCTLPHGNGGYSSCIITGRVGGWQADESDYVQCLITNRGGVRFQVINIKGGANNNLNYRNHTDIVVYLEDGEQQDATVYVKCQGYALFNINVSLYQSSCKVIWTGEKAEPTGTLQTSLLTTKNSLKLLNGKAYIGDNELSDISHDHGNKYVKSKSDKDITIDWSGKFSLSNTPYILGWNSDGSIIKAIDSSEIVNTSTNQNIGGNKTFTSQVIAPSFKGDFLSNYNTTEVASNWTDLLPKETGALSLASRVIKATPGLFEHTSNANSVLTINRHPGNYFSQLGFSDNGNIYYRSFNGENNFNNKEWNVLLTQHNLDDSGYKANDIINTNSAYKSYYANPISKYLWHDLLSFGANGIPTLEEKIGSVWEPLTYPSKENPDDAKTTRINDLNKGLFCNKESQSILVIDDENAKRKVSGIRWTWSSGSSFHVSNWAWLAIGISYSSPSANAKYTLECYKNNKWVVIGQMTTAASQTPIWLKIANESPGASKVRLTVENTGTTGYTKLATIKLLSYRWGDQGKGSEYEYPYKWDMFGNITPLINGDSSLGYSNSRWNNIFAKNIDLSNDIHAGGNVSINGNLTVKNLTVNGTTTTLATENLAVKDMIIEIAQGISGLGSNFAGLIVPQYGTTAKKASGILFDSNGKAYVGTVDNYNSNSNITTKPNAFYEIATKNDFSNTTASITNASGTPTVDVSYDDTKKGFNFSFANLKGNPGKDGYSIKIAKRTENLYFSLNTWQGWMAQDITFNYILNAADFQPNDIFMFQGYISDLNNTPITLYGTVINTDITQHQVTATNNKLIYGEKGDKGDTGNNGVSVSKIEKTSTSGLVDTYTITYSNGSTTSFTVTNGQNGAAGSNGISVSNIKKTSTSGLVDTYTITYSNGNTTTFTVTNGQNGAAGSNGYTFTPSLNDNGDLSWTKAQGAGGSTPATKNIKGPRGEKGEAGSVAQLIESGGPGNNKYISDLSLDSSTKNLTATYSTLPALPTNHVTTDTTQSISGEKTFTKISHHQAGITISEGTKSGSGTMQFDSESRCFKFIFE